MNKSAGFGLGSVWLAPLLGTAFAAALLMLLSLPVAAVVYFTTLPESVLPQIALVLDVAAALVGGLVAGRSAGCRGLMMGLIVGVFLLALMLLLGPAADNWAVKSVTCLLAAMIGGVLGVR